MTYNPVLIVAIPRSGSSLVTKIFAAHGLWVGDCGEKGLDWTPTPYPDYENDAIDQWYRDRRGTLQGVIDKIKPDGLRLVYKCSPWKARIFLDQIKSVDVVRCHRAFDSIIASGMAVGNPDTDLRQRQRCEINDFSGPVVDVDAVMRRDFDTLEGAFSYCNLTFSPDVTEAQIDNNLWHHNA